MMLNGESQFRLEPKQFALVGSVIVPILLLSMINIGLWRYYERRDHAVIASFDAVRQSLATESQWLARRKTVLTQKRFDREYDALYAEYQRRLYRYNQEAQEYDSLVRKRTARWYLIPIPVKM